jgi:methyltransferase (TIGR00027 family)
VINLAAGLDTRPYRMDVPPSLQWIEVDLPEITEYKEEVLANDKPKCQLRRVRLDLADRPARRALFAELGGRAKRAVVVSEGLLVYLEEQAAGELARDLADQKTFRRWIGDLASPGLVKMMKKKMGAELERANAPIKWGPEEGPAFFEKHGWKIVEVRSMLHTAAGLKRLPFMMRLVALFPAPPNGRAGKQPWSGAMVLENATPA